jgi:hypothetical protein
LNFPISFEDIEVFERNNNISVNVFKTIDGDSIWIRQTAIESEKNVDLLCVEDENDNYHFILIHNRSAFEGKNGVHKHTFCTFCQKRFQGNQALVNHKKECFNLNLGAMGFPKKDEYFFRKYEQTLKFPFCLYYDFECFVDKTPANTNKGLTEKALLKKLAREEKGSYTKKTAELVPSAYSFALVGPDGLVHADVYDGPNVVEHFIGTTLLLADEVKMYIKNSAKVVDPTPEELDLHEKASVCFICRKPFTKRNYKVLHHDHMSGKVIGSLHNNCNLKIKYKKVLPAVCHNATNFDNAIVARGFKRGKVFRVDAISKNSEKFLGFTVNRKVKFMDSCQFTPFSLASLTESLKKSGVEKFICTRQHFKKPDHIVDELLLSKQVYPYDYMTGPEVYDETCLPPKEKFYDSLNDKHISDADYKHAQLVWKEFECKTLRDYARIYSISDSLLLADAFENFRTNAFNEMGLDPLYNWSSPGYSWDCAMHHSKHELEYVKDYDIYFMLEAGIRGGPTFVNERIVTANNEDLGEDCPFDPNKPRARIVYNDLNSLYGWAMLQKLPYKDFKMLTEEELETIDFMALNPDDDISYILNVDLDYPEHLHDIHDDMPLAVEKRKVELNEISPLQEKLVNLYSPVVKNPLGGEKLIMSLYPKKNYTCYLKTLQFYIKKGLVITKIHKGFSFKQGYVFRDYICSNIEKRKTAVSDDMSAVFKLLNNSVFGKTLQNSKNFGDVKFCFSRDQTLKLLAKPNLKSFMPIDHDITVCYLNKTKLVLDSFLYLGFTILELAKLRLYESYYDGIKFAFGDRVRAVYGDTDSAIVVIDDPENTYYSDMEKISSWYDFSNLNSDHPLYNNTRKGEPGLWKIVINDPVEVAAISSKMYSVLTGKDVKESCEHQRLIAEGLHPPNESYGKKKELMKKGKGIGRGVLEKLQHDHYVKSITEYNKIYQVKMKGIRQYKSRLHKVEMRKIGMHALDTKRYICMNGIRTYAFGNYNIAKTREVEKALLDTSSCTLEVEELKFDHPDAKKAKLNE